MEKKEITYHFTLKDMSRVSYTVEISKQPMPEPEGLPEWTRLEFHQCEGCRWTQSDRCPVAVGLHGPAMLLDKLPSYETAEVLVETSERNYLKSTTIQEGLSGLFGLVMARSGCPAFEPFKGMAWFHLPFATHEETLFRVVGTYFMKPYLEGKTDWKEWEHIIDDIQTIYREIYEVNKGIITRLKAGAAPGCDAPFNAITILNSIGNMVAMSFEDRLEDIRSHFA